MENLPIFSPVQVANSSPTITIQCDTTSRIQYPEWWSTPVYYSFCSADQWKCVLTLTKLLVISVCTWKPESLPPFFPMLLFNSCEIIVAPGKGIIASSYELALFSSFLKTFDFSPSPLPPPWLRLTNEQSPSWSRPCDWFMLSNRVSLARANIALPTVLFTPMSTRLRLACLVRRVALSWSGITQGS